MKPKPNELSFEKKLECLTQKDKEYLSIFIDGMLRVRAQTQEEAPAVKASEP